MCPLSLSYELPLIFSWHRLRLPPESPATETVQDVERCAGFLKDLEQRWSGAARSRDIIERLLADYCAESLSRQTLADQPSSVAQGSAPEGNGTPAGAGKRPFSQYDAGSSLDIGEEDFYMNQVLGSELFAFENTDPGLIGPWGRL